MRILRKCPAYTNVEVSFALGHDSRINYFINKNLSQTSESFFHLNKKDFKLSICSLGLQWSTMFSIYLAPHEAGEVAQQAEHLPCTQSTRVQSRAYHMVPRAPTRSQFLSARPSVKPLSTTGYGPNTNKKISYGRSYGRKSCSSKQFYNNVNAVRPLPGTPLPPLFRPAVTVHGFIFIHHCPFPWFLSSFTS